MSIYFGREINFYIVCLNHLLYTPYNTTYPVNNRQTSMKLVEKPSVVAHLDCASGVSIPRVSTNHSSRLSREMVVTGAYL